MAKTTGVLSGNVVMVYRNGVAIGCTTGATLSLTNTALESTCKDNDGAITRIPGSQEWNISVNGNTKFDNAEGLEELQESWKLKETITVKFGTKNADDPYWQGQAFIETLEITGDVNAPSTWTAQFTAMGPISLFNT